MSDLVVVKFLRARDGFVPGTLGELPAKDAESLVRKGVAAVASPDLVARFRASHPADIPDDTAPAPAWFAEPDVELP
jgi:hypothetical protein